MLTTINEHTERTKYIVLCIPFHFFTVIILEIETKCMLYTYVEVNEKKKMNEQTNERINIIKCRIYLKIANIDRIAC